MKRSVYISHGALVFTVALAVRLLYLYQIQSIPFFDSPTVDGRFYDEWAERIAAGGWWSGEVFFLAPAYPYFLAILYALFGRSLMLVHVVQMVLGAASCALIHGAGRRWFGPNAGLLAGLLLAVYPPAIFFDGILHKANLLLFLTALFLYLLAGITERESWSKIALAGFVAALLALTQENMLILLIVVPLWLLLATHRRVLAACLPTSQKGTKAGNDSPLATRFRLGGVFLAFAAMPLLLVAVRNYSVGSVFAVTTSNAGQNFYIGNNSEATGLYDSFYRGRQDPRQEREDAIRIAEQTAGRAMSPGEVSAFWLRRGLEFVREHPGVWLRLLVHKVLLVWNRFEPPDAEDIALYAEWASLLGIPLRILHFGVLAPLGLTGLVLIAGQRRRTWIIPVLIASITLSVALFFVFARFRLPLVPLLVLTASAGIAALIEYPAIRTVRRITFASAVALATAFAANWPIVNEAPYHSVGFVNLAAKLRQQDRLEEAEHAFRRAIEAYPDNEFAWYQMGLLDLKRGRVVEAEASLDKAAAIAPTFAEPHLALARMLAGTNQVEEAIARYRQAIKLKPDEPEPRLELVRLLAQSGRADDAAREMELLTKLAPNDAAIREELGRLTATTSTEAPSRDDEADRLFRKATDLAAIGSFAEAIAAYQEVLKLKPNDAHLHFSLAKAYVATGNPTEASHHLQEAVRIDEKLAPAHIELGRLLADQGQLHTAIDHYRRALEADPASIPARYNLATALAALGRLDEAITAMNECLAQVRAANRPDLIPWIEDRLARLRAEQKPP